MFCPNCGKENAAGDRFCAECGEALVDNQGGWNGIDTEKAALAAKSALKGLDGRGAQALGWLRAHKKLLILVAAAAVAVIAFAVIGNHLYNPQRVAERYFEAIVEADADSAYDCLDITESEFTGRDDFAVYWAESFTPLDIYNYEVEETTDAYDDDPIERTFRFRYYLHGDGDSYTRTVTVVRGSGKKFLFFNDYKVLPDFLVNDYRFITASGMSLSLDGEPLTPSTSENGYDYYHFSTLFSRPYTFMVSHELGETEVMTVYPYNDGYDSCSELLCSSTVREEIYTLAQEQVQSIIDASIQHSGFPADITWEGGGQDAYDYLSARLYDTEEQTGYTAMVLTDGYDNSSTYQYVSIGGCNYKCSLNFYYDYSRVVLDWWSDELETRTGSSSGHATMEYYYLDGEWVLYGSSIRY